jgi:electron transport complex protein RnfA
MTPAGFPAGLGLAVFAGLSLNLMIQCALGVSGAAGPAKDSKRQPFPLFQFFCLFVSVFVLWTAYSLILKPLSGGFLDYFLFFPLCVLACLGLEALGKRLFSKKEAVRVFKALTAYDGLVPVSLILTVHMASGATDALLLAFFFALGCLLSAAILGEIRRRSALEWVPRYIRGSPLALISMGLLSIIFASGAWICLKILENF